MIFALVLFLLFQNTPELRRHIDAGLEAKAAGDFVTAIKEFTRVVELAPALPAAHVNLGAVYVAHKDYTNAISSLRKALQLDRDLLGAHAMLGAALLAQGFAREAIPHLEAAESIDLLGVALLESGQIREAVDRLEASLAKRPDDPDLMYYLSHAHDRLARQLFDKLQASNPDSARTHQMAGEALAAAGKRVEAEARLHSALAARPDLRGVHYSLGDLFQEAGDYEKAEAEFRAEVQLTPGSAAAAYKLEWCWPIAVVFRKQWLNSGVRMSWSRTCRKRCWSSGRL